MSILLYSNIEAQRDLAPARTSTAQAQSLELSAAGKPGIGIFVDSLAALVPAEILLLHALLIGYGTKTATVHGHTVTTITEPGGLQVTFWVLVALGVLIYVSRKFSTWKKTDFIRMLIPSAAFVLWAALQKSTMLDAVAPGLSSFTRVAIGTIGAVVLGLIAAAVAYNSDQQSPP